MRNLFFLLLFLANNAAARQDTALLLKPDQVFDGEQLYKNWVVLVSNNKILAAGDIGSIMFKGITRTIEMKGQTLLPGLIEGHSHLFLHPYNETKWDEQVLNEQRAERTARAVNHAKATLLAGFTTVRDLGTEGADYDDAGLKAAIEKGIIPGPRMIIATRAIVATGSYGPKLKNTDDVVIRGAAEADGIDALIRETRTQIGNGADLVKVYADYRWGLNKTAQPTFTLDELKTVVAVAASAGRKVVAHASTAEGMTRAILAGISTIEHGDKGTREVFALMARNHVAYCPTISASEATSEYDGWKKGTLPEPEKVANKRKAFSLALQEHVTICFGGDVGVFAHGDNAREMENMVAYGMAPLEVLKSATSVNADVFGYGDGIGRIKAGLLADLVAVTGNPVENISNIRQTTFVMKNGIIYVNKINNPIP
ncbi:metal-dependent hydrolase family protein [Sediminibacterium ginsengisoli]|uniref:Imidazolonepropionase n=1 Tax=Sediminibacterium ginsengisoli TaxID=413434 RepID=A0A1T4L2W4_9BACT|nr:amidohydrolase family protein [Sediminibacterium ginsengisoli]SJZ48918.1 Imidazolonepropionase [Sediminibacterium ginsengisoli]